MSGQEICIIVIPNDFPEENNENLQSVETINEKKASNKRQSTESNQNNSSIKNRKSDTSLVKNHTKEYPCSECDQSLCSRFRYHTIPKLELRDTIWIPTNHGKDFFIICYTELGPQSDGILDELRRAEIGIRDGSKVFIVPLSCAMGLQKVVAKQKILSETLEVAMDDENISSGAVHLPVATPLPSIHSSFRPFLKSIRARLTVQKIIGVIRLQSSLTFDYLFFCILASIIAGLGLLEDSTVILVASMLVSPLMGPIMGFVIGIRIRDKKLWFSGLISELSGLAVAILTGFVFGLCTTWSETSWGSSESFPTSEMRERGDYRRLWFGALLAIPSGAAAALSILGGNFGSLVGVALSASLLPPAVNTGLLFSYSLLAATRPNIGRHSTTVLNGTATYNSLATLANCTAFVDNEYLPLYSCEMPKEAVLLGVYSSIITVINIVCICIMAVVVLLIKKVIPVIPDDEITSVWKKDMKTARKMCKDQAMDELDGEGIDELAQISETIDDANGISYQMKEHIV